MSACQQLPADTAADDVRVRRGRPGRPARYTRDGLLDLVVGVFNERGYEAASMEDLAKASGLTKSTFYHHVSGKEELLRMAVDRALGRAVRRPGRDRRTAAAVRSSSWNDAIRRTTEVLLAELPYVTLLLRVRGNTDGRAGGAGPAPGHRRPAGGTGQGRRRRRRDPRRHRSAAGEPAAVRDGQLDHRVVPAATGPPSTAGHRTEEHSTARDTVDAVVSLALHGLQPTTAAATTPGLTISGRFRCRRSARVAAEVGVQHIGLLADVAAAGPGRSVRPSTCLRRPGR